jgi:hypothetical protein
LHRYNPHWKEEYELVESNSGFQRHLIPVSELKVVSDVILKQDTKDLFSNLQQVEELPNPDDNASFASIVRALNKIADSLSKIESKLNK